MDWGSVSWSYLSELASALAGRRGGRYDSERGPACYAGVYLTLRGFRPLSRHCSERVPPANRTAVSSAPLRRTGKGPRARPFAIRALRQPPLFPHSAATASRTARIRHPWLIPPSQRHPCRFVLAVTLRSALRMALNTPACGYLFFFLCGAVWGAVNGSAQTVAG